MPTPVQVTRAWYAWIFGPPGMGLNPYQGTWAGNVQYSAMRVIQGFALAMLLGIPLAWPSAGAAWLPRRWTR